MKYVSEIQAVIVLVIIALAMIITATGLCDESGIVWDRVAYYDYRYTMRDYTISTNVRNALESRGYTILNADELEVWMFARIADRRHSVLVPCQDVLPDNIVESGSALCNLRRYMEAGGKVVWYHVPLIDSQGHADLTYTYFSKEETSNILGVSSQQQGAGNNTEPAILTDDGYDWGLVQPWIPIRYLRSTNDVTVLAIFPDGRIAAWVKHYVQSDTYRGFVRIYGCHDDMPSIGDIQRVAEYPNKPVVQPEPTVVSNPPMPPSVLTLLPKPTLPGPNDLIVFGRPAKVVNVNSLMGECEAGISSDGLELYFRRDTPGWNWNLWVAKRATSRDVWEAPVDLGVPVNFVGHIEGPSISTNGLELYFSSSRPGAIGWTGVDTDYDIWVAIRETKDSAWRTPVNLGPVVNSSSWELFPSISSDGLELYFDSSRPGGQGGSDIWVTTRTTKNDPWGEPVNLGPVVNYTGYDSHPSISVDGLSLFFVCSSSRGGYGRRDIWVTTRTTTNDPWGEPKNLGPPVNSFLDESGPCISADGRWFFFDRFEGPGYWYSDIWQVEINPPVVDTSGIRLEAEEMVREAGILEESPTECRILEEDVRIGSSIVVPVDLNEVMVTIRAKAVLNYMLGARFPSLALYLDDEEVCQWELKSVDYQDFSTFIFLNKGIHKLEVSMVNSSVRMNCDIILDFVDIHIPSMTEANY